ncbi:MAG: hypothetical protein GH143_09635 [Calditrichaeota bacterium]|nr:hypothetical protein [Calditrichota bacterium]
MQILRLCSWIAALSLVLIATACEEAAEDDQVGVLVGTWQLTDLRVDWVRDVASPEGTDPDTVYTITASCNEVETYSWILAAKANRILAQFVVGDTILDTTAAFNAAALVYLQISMTATFSEDFTYALSGTYPTLRLIPDSCKTKMEIPQITDAGIYEVDYIAGRLGIKPGEFDQVLPSFDDGQITLSEDGEALTISYVDRDGHDHRIAEIDKTWDEAKHRVVHGAAELPVDLVTGAFSDTGLLILRRSGYIMDTNGHLGVWGNYLTFYALTTLGIADELIASGEVSTFEDALALIGQWADKGLKEPNTDIPYATLLTDDSDHDFSPQDIGTGGKLTYVINPVCVPVNEIIYFETTWSKID